MSKHPVVDLAAGAPPLTDRTPPSADETPKEIDPSFSRIQKAAELLNIRKFGAGSIPETDSGQPAAAFAAARRQVPAQPAIAPSARVDQTVARPEAQAAAMTAQASLPSDYAELKRQALAKAQAQMPSESRLALPAGTVALEAAILTVAWA